MRNIRIAFGAAVLAAMPVMSAEAAERFELSLAGGYFYGGTVLDKRGPDAAVGGEAFPRGGQFSRLHIQYSNAPRYGLRLAWRAGGPLLLEIEAARANNELSEGFLASPPPNLRPHPLHTDSLLAFGVLEPWKSRVRPFVSLGAGATRFDYGFGRDTRWTIGAGVGAKARLTDRVGVRLDARGYATSIPASQGSLGIYCTDYRVGPSQLIPVPCHRRDWLTSADLGGGVFFVF